MKKHAGLLLILLIAAIIRLVGIYPGYNQFHPDEQMSFSTAAAMVFENNLEAEDGYTLKYAYPYLIPLINYILFKIIFLPVYWSHFYIANIGKIFEGFINIPLDKIAFTRIMQLDILGYRYINTIYWSRLITAIFGVGNVLLVYLITKTISNKKSALVAALLLTFNFRQVVNSHIALPDIYNSFFLLLATLSFIRLYNNPTGKNYLLAGLATALAFNVKFQFFVFVPLLTTLVLTTTKSKLSIKTVNNIMAMLLITPFVTVLTNPYHLINFEETLVQITDVALKYGMGTNKLNLFPFWYMFNIDLGMPLFATSLIGIIFSLKQSFRKNLILLSTVVFQSFIFFYYSTGGFYIRNIIPVTPFLIIFSSQLVGKFITKRTRVITLPILLVLIYIPAKNSLINSYYYTKPLNFNLLSEWLINNPPDGPVASNPTDPPTGAPAGMTRTDFNHSRHFSMAEHIENGAKYALINTDWAGNDFYNWMIGHPGSFKEKWDKPINKLRNTYHGLAIEEMLNYQIFASVKPWQAPEANLILVEFPNWSSVKTKQILQIKGDIVTQKNKGSVRVAKITTKQQHLYKISSEIINVKKLTLENRDGFLRANTSTSNCISARAYDNLEPKTEFYCLAPTGSTSMEITLQIENLGNEATASNLTVEESVDPINSISSKHKYINNNVQLELIYPNSQANL